MSYKNSLLGFYHLDYNILNKNNCKSSTRKMVMQWGNKTIKNHTSSRVWRKSLFFYIEAKETQTDENGIQLGHNYQSVKQVP